MNYILTSSAKRDVNDIWDYIANDSIEAAGFWMLWSQHWSSWRRVRERAIGVRSWRTSGTVSFWSTAI